MMAQCSLCSCAKTRVFRKGTLSKKTGFSITDPTYGPGGTLLQCQGCGVVFLDPLPSPEVLAQAYADMEDPSYIEEEGVLRVARSTLLLVEKMLGRTGRLLDVGCFCGTLLSEAKAKGWEVDGVEPSRWAREKARELFGLDIRHPSLKAASFPDNTFDVVTAVDVLEHFRYPQEEVQEIRRILRPGGVLYLSTPDVASLMPRILRSRWWGFRPEHLFYFSRRSLRSFLVSLGFETVWEGFYFRSFTVSELLRRLEGISVFLSRLFSPLGKVSFLQRVQMPVNLFDRIALVARKEKG